MRSARARSRLSRTGRVGLARNRYVAEDAAALIVLITTFSCGHRPARRCAARGAASAARSNVERPRYAPRLYGDATPHPNGQHIYREELCSIAGPDIRSRRAALVAQYEPASDGITVGLDAEAHDLYQTCAPISASIEPLRVATPDVGGGFGPKLCVYPEYVAVTAAAKLLKPR